MREVLAVCDACGKFFGSGLHFDNLREARFENNLVGSCPFCGSWGHIPNGLYNFIENTIEILAAPRRSIEDMLRLREIVLQGRKQNTSPDDLRAELKRTSPELGGLLDSLPKTRNQLYAFLTVVIAAAGLLANQLRQGEQPNITVEQVVNVMLVSPGEDDAAVSRPVERADPDGSREAETGEGE